MTQIKYVFLSFSKLGLCDLCTYEKDLNEAADFARINLYGRHHILLSNVRSIGLNAFMCAVKMPSGTIFNTGNRLRGISAYLLKKYPKKYENLKVGKRLLYYSDVSESVISPKLLHEFSWEIK